MYRRPREPPIRRRVERSPPASPMLRGLGRGRAGMNYEVPPQFHSLITSTTRPRQMTAATSTPPLRKGPVERIAEFQSNNTFDASAAGPSTFGLAQPLDSFMEEIINLTRPRKKMFISPEHRRWLFQSRQVDPCASEWDVISWKPPKSMRTVPPKADCSKESVEDQEVSALHKMQTNPSFRAPTQYPCSYPAARPVMLHPSSGPERRNMELRSPKRLAGTATSAEHPDRAQGFGGRSMYQQSPSSYSAAPSPKSQPCSVAERRNIEPTCSKRLTEMATSAECPDNAVSSGERPLYQKSPSRYPTGPPPKSPPYSTPERRTVETRGTKRTTGVPLSSEGPAHLTSPHLSGPRSRRVYTHTATAKPVAPSQKKPGAHLYAGRVNRDRLVDSHT